jgi:hypothetical protein
MVRRIIYNLLFCLVLGGIIGACIGRDPPSITSSDPDRLIPAIETGVAAHDQRIVPYLVKDLESDDPAVRLYSIEGLRRMTGQDFGFVYYADDQQRRDAVKLWKAWLAQQRF